MSTWKDAIAYLKPSLDPATHTANYHFEDTGDIPVINPIDDELHVSYLIDDGSHFTYVNNRQLETAGIDLETLHQHALQNLADRFQNNMQTYQDGDVFYVAEDGDFEASLFLLNYFWDDSLKDYIAGNIVTCIPARDILVFCSDQSPDGIDRLRSIVDKIWPDGDHLITRNLYRRVDAQWEVLR